VDIKAIKRKLAARIRGHVDVDRLVAEGLEIGRVVYVAPTAYLDPGQPWLIEIDDESVIGPWAIVLAHDASTRLHTGHTLVGRVRIGRRVYVGHGAIVLPGSTIGDDAVIGPGAMVRGEIPAGAVAIGNPAHVVSDVATFAADHRAAIARDPVWPIPGWTRRRGITDERKAAQRQALTDRCGYLRSPG
jgi:maltose O-acetyltransferase